MHDFQVKATRGTGLDGLPCVVYVLADLRGEILDHFGFWYSRKEAEAKRDALESPAPEGD